eukprot:NODE_787_length_3895_cov_0.922813.p3 type:complete len:113 gc:universal NODE_787_length_3895_cov_0.922813:685-1023(+)
MFWFLQVMAQYNDSFVNNTDPMGLNSLQYNNVTEVKPYYPANISIPFKIENFTSTASKTSSRSEEETQFSSEEEETEPVTNTTSRQRRQIVFASSSQSFSFDVLAISMYIML